MSTYICEKCGCIDNTACGGNYWIATMYKHNKKDPPFEDEYANNHLLCCECTPSKYADGSNNSTGGKWHGRFPKVHWEEYGSKEQLIEECKKGRGNVINAIEYFKTHS